jgi:hypothetical protein
MDVKKLFWPYVRIQNGNGEKSRFWEDISIGESSLANTFPGLYSVSKDHNITVASVINSGVENLKIQRALVGERWSLWDALRNLCRNVVLNDNEEDRLIWTLSPSGVFSVKSFYLAMQSCGSVPYKFLWKVKLPLRIKIFMWLVLKKSILTRDVLLKRRGKCNT